MLKHSVVFLGLLAVCFAALARAPLQPKPEKFKHKEGCFVSDLEDVIPFGSSAPCHHHCMQYYCYKNELVIETCGAIAAGRGLKVVEDHSKPYPHCCGTLQKITRRHSI